MSAMAKLLAFLSTIFGWVYTFCWSASFYPQPLLNLRRRSTSGTTVDFPFINCLGESTPSLHSSTRPLVLGGLQHGGRRIRNTQRTQEFGLTLCNVMLITS